MNITLQIFLLIGILFYFSLVIYFLKKKMLLLKYILLWLLFGVIMLTIAIYPPLMEWVSNILGFASIVNAVFALMTFFLIIILMSITSIVSRQSEKSKKIIQTIAILENRVRQLEDNGNEQSKFINKNNGDMV